MTNRFGTADDWENGDVLGAPDLLDTFNSIRFIEKVTNTIVCSGIAAHSATTWSTISIGVIKQTSDSAVTWTTKNSDLDSVSYLESCRGDRTHAFAIEYTQAAETCFTDDSGATWTTATTHTWGAGGRTYDTSFVTTGLIVVAGDDGAGGKHIVYSTDDAVTWTDPTTAPSAACYTVGMFDANTGYAIDTAGNIWKTTDGCDTWVDTTDNLSVNMSTKIICTSATEFVCLVDANSYHYNNGTNTVTTIFHATLMNNPTRCSGIDVDSNGTVFMAFAPGSTTRDNQFLSYSRTPSVIGSWSVIRLISRGEVNEAIYYGVFKSGLSVTGNVLHVTNLSLNGQSIIYMR